MWQRKGMLLVVLLAAISSVHSSCDQISLSGCSCEHPKDRSYEIDCHSKGLSAMPAKVNVTLSDGYASGNFSFNSIESIPSYYFLFMSYFEALDFTANRLAELNQNSFAGLEARLKTLILKQNRLSSIPATALRKYIRLNYLDLSFNKLASSCQIHTADIETYVLASNDIKTIPDNCFSESANVQSLDLSRNEISSVGEYAFDGMTRLKSLDLGYNQLTDLGLGFRSLSGIDSFEVLSLRGNSMVFLGSICKTYLPNIKVIDLSYNELIDIRKYCFTPYAQSVTGPKIFLNFEHNMVEALAGSAFAGLSDRLTRLQLNNNHISEVNVNTFKDLRSLAILNLDNNAIDNLEFLRNWEGNSLLELSIANNLITRLAPSVFRTMVKLTKLSLDGNLLTTVESAAFNGMFVLDDLSLNYNLLTNLEDGAFSGLDQLRKLRLTGNALVTLKNCTFFNLDRLVLFHYDDNLLLCDCDLLWLLPFRSAIDRRGIPDRNTDEPVLDDKCHYPEEYAGRDMVNMVSYKCSVETTNACFGLSVSYDDPVEQAMNVSREWNTDRADGEVSSIILTQTEVKTNTTIYNESQTNALPPYLLSSIEDDTIYKICVTVRLDNKKEETDCTVYPGIIKKPTTTLAPTTEMITPSSRMHPGSIAAIILAILFIILLVLIVLFALYLWKTEKYRDLMPAKYATAGEPLSYNESIEDSPSSSGKADPSDFKELGEDEPMVIRRPPDATSV
ncbi:leucine-rich repeat-containing protein 15-like [Watersipora subatra]|uniref:leucine-rich repeat-containing protein 15-like n=1 Tax=Watersipora subatra TaxID=2589382 RepID=UPI00355B4799